MAASLNNLVNEFREQSKFIEHTPEESAFGGSLVTKIGLHPDAAFELLEVLYGDYEDPHAGYLFIDRKTSWERYFHGPTGDIRVYDFRGSVSIGSSGRDLLASRPEAYVKDCKEFSELLESFWLKYQEVKAELLREEIAENPMGNFSRAFLSTRILLERARESGSLLELLILNATLLDGLLRLGLVLKTQLSNNSDDIQRELIYQDSPTFISERKIYQKSRDEGIITEDDFTEINRLYDFRNVAIHRYFISDLEYTKIADCVISYEVMVQKVNESVRLLEEEQVEKGVGMTKKEDAELGEALLRKIRREEYLKIDSQLPVALIPERKYMFPADDERYD